MIRIRPALPLAVAATGTAVCMSVLAGWQRGGWLAERLVWVAIGVVLVVGAHLLPALCRSVPLVVRVVGFVLWLGCMVAASYGHSTFFILSQSHAGEKRMSTIPVASIPVHRNLPVVMAARATVTALLAEANARRCIRDCPTLRLRRVSLTARLDALNAEAAEVRRYQAIEDGNVERRDAARDDPVTARLAILCGLPEAGLDLFAGLAFATVLEGVACLLWWIALLPRESQPVGTAHPQTLPVVTTTVSGVTPAVPPATPEPHPDTETEVTKLCRDIKSGIVKPTVVSIRHHLGCSQAKAATLRRQLADLTA